MDPVEKSRVSGELNWRMEVGSSLGVCGFGAWVLGKGEGESESERAGRTRAASFLATRLAYKFKLKFNT
jgi:hypothetical protein